MLSLKLATKQMAGSLCVKIAWFNDPIISPFIGGKILYGYGKFQLELFMLCFEGIWTLIVYIYDPQYVVLVNSIHMNDICNVRCNHP